MMQTFRHPEKWRETIDPFALHFHTFSLTEVLGYPHAGNDVFQVKGVLGGAETAAYIKVARRKDAAIENEVALLRQLKSPVIPRLLDCDFGKHPYSVTSEMPGMRLSHILGGNENMDSLSYMEEYGAALAKIHAIKPDAQPVMDRKFFHVPSDEVLDRLNLGFLKKYFANSPTETFTVFCHGDFHYANLLWENHHISAILDFELAGYGNRDYDIAWAIIRRPGQRFMKTKEEHDLFLKGYASQGPFNEANIRYYMAQIYVYFMDANEEDTEYCEFVCSWLTENCRHAARD
ncbi:MAG: aminoglycoside phosphotransferase family protein [Clostridiales bacterium]|nr:aminoglycoside phosphotransferase family protein [Clostridiales bacterium]